MDGNVTTRTKRAVRDWANLKPTSKLVLDDFLDDLRPSSSRDQLRPALNEEFKGEKKFPITPTEWESIKPKQKTVRDVRDEVAGRLE